MVYTWKINNNPIADEDGFITRSIKLSVTNEHNEPVCSFHITISIKGNYYTRNFKSKTRTGTTRGKFTVTERDILVKRVSEELNTFISENSIPDSAFYSIGQQYFTILKDTFPDVPQITKLGQSQTRCVIQ